MWMLGMKGYVVMHQTLLKESDLVFLYIKDFLVCSCDLLERVLQHHHKEFVLVAKVGVDALLVDACIMSDVIDARPTKAMSGKTFVGGRSDSAAGLECA